MQLISFVIPCYRSANTIGIVVQEITDVIAQRSDTFDYEIILVNDASPDNTLDVIRKLCAEDMRIKALNLSRNFGQHPAVMAGFGAARGDLVVSMDDDGQTPASEVFRMIEKLEEGYDIVFARYQKEERRSWFRRIGTEGKEAMNRIMLGKPKEIVFNSFFVVRRYVVQEVIKYINPYPYLGGLLYRTSSNVANIDVHHRKRAAGSSTYTIHKLIRIILNEMTSFSVKPLRIATLMGSVLAAIGFLFMLAVILRRALQPGIPAGWSSIISIMLFLGGMQMILLGIIGEYIGRIYICLNKTPQYVIKETINMFSREKEEKK